MATGLARRASLHGTLHVRAAAAASALALPPRVPLPLGSHQELPVRSFARQQRPGKRLHVECGMHVGGRLGSTCRLGCQSRLLCVK
mmetsp:Transcript_13316/g.41765  ORF Transcript_13316/g.41765 Transcript_13316/m.41765 type:complete len:86 (-) Transcript_13316:440-697(-)